LEGQEDECRRGHHAYPALILNDLNHFRGPNTTALQFLSCTGSSTEDLLLGGARSQIDDLNGTELTDFAVLSVGGNDLGFFDVINSCIFRFYSFYSGTCEEALQRTDRLIQGTEFDERLQVAIMEILDKVQWEKQPWFTITTTGYARFFNADTEDCDQCSFGIWWHGPKLTRDIRQRMNDMVLAVNAKIRSSVAAINARFTKPRVLFVDYDAKFDGHRFCEPNITEPDYNRTDTWFFLVGGTDNELPNATESKMASGLRSDATAAHTHAALPPQSPLVNPATCLDPARDSGDWGELALCYMAMAMERDPTLRLAPGELAVYNSMW
jgi:SAGA-associated factor 73